MLVNIDYAIIIDFFVVCLVSLSRTPTHLHNHTNTLVLTLLCTYSPLFLHFLIFSLLPKSPVRFLTLALYIMQVKKVTLFCYIMNNKNNIFSQKYILYLFISYVVIIIFCNSEEREKKTNLTKKNK